MKLLTFFAAAAIAIFLAVPTALAQQGGVAILDIDRVAQELNVDKAVAAELQLIGTDLNTELTQIRTNLQNRMQQFESRAGQNRSQQVQAELAAANRQLNAQFNQVKAQAQNKMAAERIKKINDFREQVKPLAQEAAKARGLDVVMTKSPQVFTFVAAVDITDDVIEAAKAAGLEAEVPETPAPAPATTESGTAPATEAPTTGEAGTATEESAAPAGGTAPAPAPTPAVPEGNGGN